MSDSFEGQRPSRPPESRDLHGIHSVDVAIAVMRALASSRGPLSLKSELCCMDPSKLHRYLHSLTKAGMVVQRRTGEYDLADETATCTSRRSPSAWPKRTALAQSGRR